MGHRLRIRLAGLSAAIVLTGLSSTVEAAEPTSRLVSCGTESCLLVTGHRSDTASPVSINDHRVAVEGGRSWRVRLPLDTVRTWSAPHARHVAVSVERPDGNVETADASLPIGLLGHVTDLAALVVRVH